MLRQRTPWHLMDAEMSPHSITDFAYEILAWKAS
jgi:hypothetical protein